MHAWLERGWRWFIRLGTITLLIFLASIAWENLERYRQRVEQAERLRAAIATEQIQATRLAEMARYVQSEEFVARWARLEAGMVRPQETPYRLKPPPTPTPAVPTPTSTPLPWQAWWMRIRGR